MPVGLHLTEASARAELSHFSTVDAVEAEKLSLLIIVLCVICFDLV